MDYYGHKLCKLKGTVRISTKIFSSLILKLKPNKDRQTKIKKQKEKSREYGRDGRRD